MPDMSFLHGFSHRPHWYGQMFGQHRHQELWKTNIHISAVYCALQLYGKSFQLMFTVNT